MEEELKYLRDMIDTLSITNGEKKLLMASIRLLASKAKIEGMKEIEVIVNKHENN